jgi:hypothetical protein
MVVIAVSETKVDVWTYVIRVDRGGAPNFEAPATTLTVCKPRIRKRAKVGELVLAFNGKSLNPVEPHSVCWAGIVSEVIPIADYWNDPRFDGKKPGRHRGPRELPDNIYQPTATGSLGQVRNDTHTAVDVERDLGGLNALVLQRSWYFGPTVAILPAGFGLRMIGGRRGERHSQIDEHTWHDLKRWLDDNLPAARRFDAKANSADRCSPVRRSPKVAVRRHQC